jgi:hypothetical protein
MKLMVGEVESKPRGLGSDRGYKSLALYPSTFRLAFTASVEAGGFAECLGSGI